MGWPEEWTAFGSSVMGRPMSRVTEQVGCRNQEAVCGARGAGGAETSDIAATPAPCRSQGLECLAMALSTGSSHLLPSVTGFALPFVISTEAVDVIPGPERPERPSVARVRTESSTTRAETASRGPRPGGDFGRLRVSRSRILLFLSDYCSTVLGCWSIRGADPHRFVRQSGTRCHRPTSGAG